MSVTPTKTAETKTPTASPKPEIISPMKTDSPVEVDAATQALNHFAQGKRHLLVNDINSAVNSLQEACRMLAKQHGETATECGDAYFYYGRALLEMSRIESGVLGNALEGVPEGEEDIEDSQVESPDKLPEEEKEKVAEQVGEALEENFKSLEKASPSKDGKDKDTVNGKSDEPMEDLEKTTKAKLDIASKDENDKSEEGNADSAMDTDSGKKDGSGDESEDVSQDDESQEEGESQEEDADVKEADGEEKGDKTEEDADDVSNLQLAWEMLELAKVIFKRQTEGDKAMSLKTAQVHLKLGEVCLENENYPQSIEDFQSCLKMQETHMETDDRCLAETHYQLGVAFSFSDDFDKAIESFTKAFKIIEAKVANLEKRKGEESKEQKDKDAKVDATSTEDEIKELNNLIPDIKEKIDDMEEMKKDAKDKINKVKKELGMASAIGGTSSDAKSLDSSMIRKKRKPEDASPEDAKKSKAVNGENTETSVKNGHSSPEEMDTDKITSDDSKDKLKEKALADKDKKIKELKEQSA